MRSVDKSKFYYKKSSSGITLLDTILACVLIGIILALFIPSAREFYLRAQEVTCIANMRGITVALHAYLQDHQNIWPQGPSPDEEKPWEEFWLQVLKPYDIRAKNWQCPACNSALAAQGAPPEEHPRVHYIPTLFPATPGIATRWATQPWLIERASVHKHGPHICFPDGSVKSFDKVLAEQGVR